MLTSTRMKKTRTKKKRIGNSFRALALLLAVSSCWAGDHKDKPAEVYAVVAGTVFRVPGFALPGAEVSLEPDKAKPKDLKVKGQRITVNNRGEFAFHVPAVPLRYTVSVKAKGYRSEEKQVAIQGEERVDVYFQLQPDTPTP